MCGLRTLSDILTNTFGGAFGFWVPTWLAPSRKAASWLAAIWGAIWVLIQAVSSYSLSPALSASKYYGQIARPGARAMFHGQVDSARIGTIPIPNGALANSRSIRQQLLNGAPIVAVVRLDEPTPNFASIVRIADQQQRAITAIAEEGDRLVFSIRTGASKLRLREPAFGMPGVFTDAIGTHSSLLARGCARRATRCRADFCARGICVEGCDAARLARRRVRGRHRRRADTSAEGSHYATAFLAMTSR